MRKICLKIHRWLGLALGIFIAIICFTGAILVFQDEIKEGITHDNTKAVNMQGNHHHNDPAVIDFAKKLHRYLLNVPEEPHEGMSAGRFIVGSVAICMTIILITGIIAWWPKNKKMLKSRLKVRTNKGFRWFVYDSHVSLGIYAVLFLLTMSLTGPSWSFHWYRQGAMAVLGGDVNQMEHHGKMQQDELQQWQVSKPQNENKAEAMKPRFDRPPKHDGKKPPQAVLMELHTGKLLGLPMKIIYFIAAIIGGFLPISGYYLWWKRHSAIKKGKRTAKAN